MIKYTSDNVAIKQFWHYIQLMFTDKFQLYDYQPNNQKFYGSNVVPMYNLSNLNVPITIFYGTPDSLVNFTVSSCTFSFNFFLNLRFTSNTGR